MKPATIIAGICSIIALASCGGSSTSEMEITHYPFKESKSDRWGIADANGKASISDEFSEEPSLAINNLFFVGGETGYSIYDANSPKKSLASGFSSIAYFTEDCTPSVRTGEKIKYVNKNGKVKFELPKEYIGASLFRNGYSIIVKKESGESICGVVDTKGNIFQPKLYSIISVLPNENFLASKNDSEDEEQYIIDKSEKVIHRLKSIVTDISPDSKYYIFQDDNLYGLRKISGEVIIVAKYDAMAFMDEKHIAVLRDGGWGIIDIKGNTIIKNKYAIIIPALKDNMFIAQRDQNDGFGLLTLDEDRIIDFDYRDLFFLNGSNNIVGTRKKSNTVTIMNKEGKELKEFYSFPSMLNIAFMTNFKTEVFGNFYLVCSEFFDAEAYVETIMHPSKEEDFFNLYGDEGKSAETIVNENSQSIEVSDIDRSDNLEWLPAFNGIVIEEEYISYSLGFNKIIDTYQDYGGVTRYCYASNSKCIGVYVQRDLDEDARKNSEKILEATSNYLSKTGYSSSNDKNGWKTFKNGSSTVKVAIIQSCLHIVLIKK